MYQVLIVDDEPIVKIALRSMLDWGSLGFHICGRCLSWTGLI